MKTVRQWLTPCACLLFVSMVVFVSTPVLAADPDASYVLGPGSPNQAVTLAWPDGEPLSVTLRVVDARPSYVPASVSPGTGASYTVAAWGSNPRTMTFSHPDHADDIVVEWRYDPDHVWSVPPEPVDPPDPDVSYVFGPDSPNQIVTLAWPDGEPLSVILRVHDAKPSYVPASVSPGTGASYTVALWGSNPRIMTFSHPDHADDIIVQWSYDPDHVDVVDVEIVDEDATLARIRRAFVGNAITVEDFVLALPGHHKSRSLLLLESQAGDAEFVSSSTPRAISWGATANDLFSWGTNDQSPRYDQVEFITKEHGEWVFGVIDFASSPPVLSRETDACHTCHVNGHPIWGVFYSWPGTPLTEFGDVHVARDWVENVRSSGDSRVTQVSVQAGYGVGDLTAKSIEMEDALATRHGEVLIESIMPADGVITADDAIAYAEQLLCPKGRDTTLRDVDYALQALFPVDHLPYAMRDDDGTVRDVDGDRPLELHGYYYFGNSFSNSYSVMALYLIRYLVEHDDDLMELYAGLDNLESTSSTSTGQEGLQYRETFLHYPSGTATVLDELDSRAAILFDLKGLAQLEYRMDLLAGRASYIRNRQVALRDGHLVVMVPKVCGVLYPE